MSDMSLLPSRRLFTIEEYEAMLETGIFDPEDRLELIDGDIIQMTPANPPHGGSVIRLTTLFSDRLRDRMLVSVQNAIRLFPHSLPMPDIALLRPDREFYSVSHPQPPNTLLVVEVSDTTLRYDLDRKVPLYARYAIREVWVVDVRRPVLHVFRKPSDEGTYQESFAVSRDENVTIEAFPDVVFQAQEILG